MKGAVNYTLANQGEKPYSIMKMMGSGLLGALPALAAGAVAPWTGGLGSVAIGLGGAALQRYLANKWNWDDRNKTAMLTGNAIGGYLAPDVSRWTEAHVRNPHAITSYKVGDTSINEDKMSDEMKGITPWTAESVKSQLNLRLPRVEHKEELIPAFQQQLKEQDAYLKSRFGADVLNEQKISMAGLDSSQWKHMGDNYNRAIAGLVKDLNAHPGKYFNFEKSQTMDDWRHQLNGIIGYDVLSENTPAAYGYKVGQSLPGGDLYTAPLAQPLPFPEARKKKEATAGSGGRKQLRR